MPSTLRVWLESLPLCSLTSFQGCQDYQRRKWLLPDSPRWDPELPGYELRCQRCTAAECWCREEADIWSNPLLPGGPGGCLCKCQTCQGMTVSFRKKLTVECPCIIPLLVLHTSCIGLYWVCILRSCSIVFRLRLAYSYCVRHDGVVQKETNPRMST